MNNSDPLLEKPKFQELVDKLKEIQLGFRQNLSNLHLKLELLDSRTDLQSNLDILRKDAQTRVSDLEVEVKRLREDLESVRELLGLNLDKYNSVKS